MRKFGLEYKWLVLISSSLVAAIGMGISFSFGVFFKSLQADFDISRTITSAVVSLFLILSPVFGILVSWLLDRYGPLLAFTLIGVFTGLSLILTSRVTATWQIFITYSVLLAVGVGPIFAVAMSTVARQFLERRGFAMGIVSASGCAGVMIISPVAAYIIAHTGWQMAYVVLGLLAFFGMTPLALIYLRQPQKMVAGQTPGLVIEKHTRWQGGGFSYLTNGRFWHMLIILATGAVCIYIITTHLVPHATDLGIVPTRAAFLLSLFNGVSAVSRVTMGRLSDRIGRKRLIVVSALAMALCMFWLISIKSFGLLVLFAVIFGFVHGGYATPLHALIGDTFMGRNLGVIMATLDFGWGAGAAGGSALAGYVFDSTGSYSYAFMTAGICMLVVMVLAVFFKSRAGRMQVPTA